ncbi:CubicO group peptidase (beta-lactamase class C family) [Flavobacterium dankookense]|uniref:CubicO group peptidase (Beta-lactamase class C family) n=2 Tax=Flavobacterium dankookense TaxID=706186 RepID=A0A4V3CSJ1_9FLAO|nr:CubicO group peptidase (beta-lactamase class C family) [Flavobacterium dankookense]
MHMKTLLITFFSFFLLFFSSPKSLQEQDGLGYSNNDSTLISIPFPIKFNKVSDEYLLEKKVKTDSFYDKFIGTYGFSGSFIVTKNGKIISEKYQGYANQRTKELITVNTPLHLASVSKVLTATAILKLVDNDNIMLDQKVTDWLPSFPYKNTTIRTLLNHRSGLQHYSRFPELLKKGWNRKKIVSNQDILDLIVKHKFKLLTPHDTRFDYCNTNYIILALIIEKATGLKYEKAMKELIFRPLGMKNTFVFDYFRDKDTVSLSYRKGGLNPWDQFDNLNGDKNIYSTARDLVKFDLATYSPDFIKPETLKEVYTSYSPYMLKYKKDYGLGMRMKQLPNGENLWFHNGWWHGNTSSFIPMKKDTVTIICLSNVYTTKTYETLKLAETHYSLTR